MNDQPTNLGCGFRVRARMYAFDTCVSLQELEQAAAPSQELAEWDHVQNLDVFFTRIYKFYEEKGLWCILISRILNILTLGFTIAFSGFLLLFVDWGAVRRGCPVEDACDFYELAVYKYPLQHGPGRFTSALVVMYLMVFSLYWVWTVARFFAEVAPLLAVHRFCRLKLGLATRELQTMAWAELVRRVVQAQSSMRLCVVRELTALDIVARVMRKENYLVAMINKDVLRLTAPVPGLRGRVMLTKTLEWNLYWCVLDCMFDEHFLVRRDFVRDARLLRQRLRFMAVCNVLVSPFLVLFLLTYFFLRNAETIYHHPSSVGARHWSSLAQWKLRQLNELPHTLSERLSQAYPPATKYVAQFPSPFLSMVAKFVAFVVGAFAAAIIGLAVVDERLLEAHVNGRKLVWYAAIFGTVLAVSRALITEDHKVFCPEAAMQEVVKCTHYFPKRWRNRCHHKEVQSEFQRLFQYKAVGFCEEMLGILVTPAVLWFSLPQCAAGVLAFVRDFTVRVDGVGDVCSLSVFDFARHGNAKYASPVHCPKHRRSNQGKMEKSFLSFRAMYQHWEPDAHGRQVLSNLHTYQPGLEASQLLQSQLLASTHADMPALDPAFGPLQAEPCPPERDAHPRQEFDDSNSLASSGLMLARREVEMHRSQLALQGYYAAHSTHQFQSTLPLSTHAERSQPREGADSETAIGSEHLDQGAVDQHQNSVSPRVSQRHVNHPESSQL